ncbi:MAG TPA: PAS domain-containing sensor histidine kinase [Acidimicrobiia bacterium]
MQDLGDFFRRIPVPLYRTTPDGKLIAGNPALAELLGFGSVEAMERGMSPVEAVYVDPPRRDIWLQKIEAEGVVHEFDVELKRVDGSTVWVQDTARAVRDESGEIIYYEGALIDVTAKVAAERSRNEFIATVSHELRSPMTVVLGLGEELANNYDSFNDEERRDLAALIARQAEDATWLLEDLLVAYRQDPEAIVFEIEEFDLVKATERVLEVAEREITVHVETTRTMAKADPRRTRQVIRNLVSNAVRYGGPEISVVLRSAGDRLELSVRDNGEPISTEEVERIFRPFQRGSGPDVPTSVGLGLTVARKLARLMDGDLVYRREGGLTSFVLSLPAA